MRSRKDEVAITKRNEKDEVAGFPLTHDGFDYSASDEEKTIQKEEDNE